MKKSRFIPRIPKRVEFSLLPEVHYIEVSQLYQYSKPRRSRLTMANRVFQMFEGKDVTDSMLADAAVLFGENYGVWGEQSTGKFAKPGRRVRLSKDRLRSQYLPDNAACLYVRATVDGYLAGNAFACRWVVGEKTVCWVTQLVVDRNYRERGLAKGLLNELKQDDVNLFGLMSSHPAACLAAAKSLGDHISLTRIDIIAKYAAEVMEASPISYVRDAKLRGSAFDPSDSSGLVSSVDSGFLVDHTEPLEALALVRQQVAWPLGDLFDGHEFLLVIVPKQRSRSICV